MRDSDGLGACQLPAETDCTLDSDCPEPLVCRDRQCTNACEDDRDCPPGSVCGEDESGAFGCRDEAASDCQINSDCPELLVCAVDHRCRVECRVSRDCPTELICGDWLEPPRCVGPEAGRPDAGMDASVEAGMDAAPLDSGMDSGMDAGPVDSGMDAGPLDSGALPSAAAGIDNLVAGFGHNCGALTASDLRCWGDDSNSQLGDSMTSSRPTPFALSLTGVQRLAAGNGHSCAATSGGLFCWGDNRRGQVGVGSGASVVAPPTAVSGVGAIMDLAAGRDHTCALTAARVLCWGANDRGQLGDGSATDRGAPTAVVGLSAVPVALAARGNHTCALMPAGTVQCWGDNRFGQLGNGATATSPVSRPVNVVGLTGIIGITAGGGFTCALNGSGKVSCWGDGSFGSFGDGTSGLRTSPGATVLLSGVTQVAGGVRHACALTDAGKVFCWGDNAASQLGRPAGAPFSSSTPLEVTGVGAPLEVNAGQSHSCVRLSGGFRCWGTNTLGQLGDGSRTISTSPVNVSWP
ncbi:MAG: chromosome condensation regulator RCC1 [Deltaproteobacteria bacterium]|nr:chromosome condensation regulator RCC1 [Deltaproteobacteria bacterium]